MESHDSRRSEIYTRPGGDGRLPDELEVEDDEYEEDEDGDDGARHDALLVHPVCVRAHEGGWEGGGTRDSRVRSIRQCGWTGGRTV